MTEDQIEQLLRRLKALGIRAQIMMSFSDGREYVEISLADAERVADRLEGNPCR